MAKADFLTGLVLLALGLFMIAEGISLPGAGGVVVAGGEPGRVPILLGAIIAVLAFVLVSRSVLRGGYRLAFPRTIDPEWRGALWRAAATAVGCSFYAVGMVGRSYFGWPMSYELATFLFMAAFIVVAEWELAPGIAARRLEQLRGRAPAAADGLTSAFDFVPDNIRPRLWLMATALFQAAVITAIVTYVFREKFYVRLP